MFKLLSNSIISNRLWLFLTALTNLSIPVSEAGTIVRVETLVGSFAIELFDDVAPLTTANFLNYVNSGRYNGTFIHRSAPGFVIQGGNWSFDEENQVFFEIETDDPVVNEFNSSNTRGTIAMAKLGNNPDSATNEWFINLADNLSLDSSNGGFTVFGEILGNGMEVVDAIAALPVGRTQVIPFDIPIIDFTGGTLANSNLVNVEISVLPNVYDSQTGILTLSVDAQSFGLLRLSFAVLSVADGVIQAQENTVTSLTGAIDNMATFDQSTGRLVIPELALDGEIAFSDVVFVLTDGDQLLFQVESFTEN